MVNRRDSTLRNTQSSNKRFLKLAERIKGLEQRVRLLEKLLKVKKGRDKNAEVRLSNPRSSNDTASDGIR